jgi:hypothetical protein
MREEPHLVSPEADEFEISFEELKTSTQRQLEAFCNTIVIGNEQASPLNLPVGEPPRHSQSQSLALSGDTESMTYEELMQLSRSVTNLSNRHLSSVVEVQHLLCHSSFLILSFAFLIDSYARRATFSASGSKRIRIQF